MSETEKKTKMRRRELVPVPVCGCAMFYDFLLVMLYTILSFFRFLFFYYYWRLLFFIALQQFSPFFYTFIFSISSFSCLFFLSESCVTVMSLIGVQCQDAILIINVFFVF
ncbi:Uncharacterized protein APZ42_017091 [Daphnia magna]|uniref:Uncharacterized protein n=1 Tax=Daphnia magna TaxID=35525 RepID=A0A165A198_9CRUS|nr:Uncharacterized protein APZ42_017091 [Daphnia magna]